MQHVPSYLNPPPDHRRPEVTAVYDELTLWASMSGNLLLQHVPLDRFEMLDVGCGTGFPLLELAQRMESESSATGIDPWGAAIERVRQKAAVLGIPNVTAVEGDAAAMPFEDDTFDLVVSNLGINNFPQPGRVLREIYRVMRSPGILALATNTRDTMKEFYEVFARVLDADGRTRLEAHLAARPTRQTLCSLLSEHGFDVHNVVESSATLRFANMGAFLRHSFVRIGFVEAWKEIVEESERPAVFRKLENDRVGQHEMTLTIPLVYIEASPVDKDEDDEE